MKTRPRPTLAAILLLLAAALPALAAQPPENGTSSTRSK